MTFKVSGPSAEHRRHASRPWQPEGDRGRRRCTPALPSTQGVVIE